MHVHCHVFEYVGSQLLTKRTGKSFLAHAQVHGLAAQADCWQDPAVRLVR